MAAAWTAVLLFCAVPSNRCDVAFEIRDRGILWIMGWLRFVPWTDITECRWIAVWTILGVPLRLRMPKPRLRSRFTMVERNIARGRKDVATAALARFAPVYDSDGALLAGPERTGESPAATTAPRKRYRWRFQFDLQSLMLFVVVVSCIASCYGMHYRRLQPQREAFAKLATFHPSAQVLDDVVTSLDFSNCTKKPTDADLVSLEPLEDLSYLNLSETPITDAGLAHLKPLKRLDSLWLSGPSITDAGVTHLKGLQGLTSLGLRNTQVTSKGLAELLGALPDVDIFYGSSKATVTVRSADRQ